MTKTYFKVSLVVGGRDLEDAGPKFKIHMLVSHDRDSAVLLRQFNRQGANNMLANQVLIAGVLGVHRYRRICWNGFRTGGGNGEESPWKLGYLHAKMVHVTLLLLHHHFFV